MENDVFGAGAVLEHGKNSGHGATYVGGVQRHRHVDGPIEAEMMLIFIWVFEVVGDGGAIRGIVKLRGFSEFWGERSGIGRGDGDEEEEEEDGGKRGGGHGGPAMGGWLRFGDLGLRFKFKIERERERVKKRRWRLKEEIRSCTFRPGFDVSTRFSGSLFF